MLRIVLLVIILVLAPTAAFFLWAWAAKIKQERKIAGTLPQWQDLRNPPNVNEYLRRQALTMRDYADHRMSSLVAKYGTPGAVNGTVFLIASL